MCKFARQFVLAGFALALGAGSFDAQENPCLTRTVAVNVIGSEDEAVKGLDAARFRGKYHGQNAEIVSAKYDTGPRKILFLIDTSGAMLADQAKWKSELVMAEGVISWMPPQTWFGLVTFAGRPDLLTGFIQGRKGVNEALARLETPTLANETLEFFPTMTESILHGFKSLGDVHAGDVICVISDGAGDPGQARKDEVEQTLLAKGIRLFGFLPESALPDRPASPETSAGPAMLRDLIGATGGDYLIFSASPPRAPNSPPSAPAALSDQDRSKILVASRSFAEEMNELYLLQIKLPAPVGETREWTLVAESKGKDSNLRVIYPRRLAKCP